MKDKILIALVSTIVTMAGLGVMLCIAAAFVNWYINFIQTNREQAPLVTGFIICVLMFGLLFSTFYAQNSEEEKKP